MNDRKLFTVVQHDWTHDCEIPTWFVASSMERVLKEITGRMDFDYILEDELEEMRPFFIVLE